MTQPGWYQASNIFSSNLTLFFRSWRQKNVFLEGDVKLFNSNNISQDPQNDGFKEREYMRCKQALGLLILAFSDQIASFSIIIHVNHHNTQVLCWPFHFSLKICYNRDPLHEPWKFSDFSFMAQSRAPVGNHGRY